MHRSLSPSLDIRHSEIIHKGTQTALNICSVNICIHININIYIYTYIYIYKGKGVIYKCEIDNTTVSGRCMERGQDLAYKMFMYTYGYVYVCVCIYVYMSYSYVCIYRLYTPVWKKTAREIEILLHPIEEECEIYSLRLNRGKCQYSESAYMCSKVGGNGSREAEIQHRLSKALLNTSRRKFF